MHSATTILDRLRRGVASKDADPNALASQLHVNVERFSVAEALFQPAAILGLEQAGLVEAIDDLLRIFTVEERLRLGSSVFITGGMSRVEGLEARVRGELERIQPVGADLSMRVARDAHLDTWCGAAALVRQEGDRLPWITRAWYEEHGGERLAGVSWFTNQF